MDQPPPIAAATLIVMRPRPVGPPDILVVDVELPGLNGVDLAPLEKTIARGKRIIDFHADLSYLGTYASDRQEARCNACSSIRRARCRSGDS